MTRIFRKYSFANKEAADIAIASLGVDEDGNPSHPHSVVVLGNIIETEGTYDDEGTEITPHTFSSTYHVDVLWSGQVNSSWDSNMVWCPPMGIHTFGSSSAIREWTEKCKELHPEYFPEPTEEDLI
jgi:hypothetical protein